MNNFKITCYGETKTYSESQRKEMMQFYLEGMASCEGSEQERYTNIYLALASGLEHCKDRNR
jgi:hypothetical protein